MHWCPCRGYMCVIFFPLNGQVVSSDTLWKVFCSFPNSLLDFLQFNSKADFIQFSCSKNYCSFTYQDKFTIYGGKEDLWGPDTELFASISWKELLQRCYTLFPYSLITRRSRSWNSFLYYLLVASFFAWLSFLFLFFSSIEKGTVLSNNLVKPSFIAYMMKWLWARLIAAFLWPLHNLAKILVYKKIHSAIGISKVY